MHIFWLTGGLNQHQVPLQLTAARPGQGALEQLPGLCALLRRGLWRECGRFNGRSEEKTHIKVLSVRSDR